MIYPNRMNFHAQILLFLLFFFFVLGEVIPVQGPPTVWRRWKREFTLDYYQNQTLSGDWNGLRSLWHEQGF